MSKDLRHLNKDHVTMAIDFLLDQSYFINEGLVKVYVQSTYHKNIYYLDFNIILL